MPQITCFKCEYQWNARLDNPKGCPRCGQRLDRKRPAAATTTAPTIPEPSKAALVHEERPEAAPAARIALDEALDHADIEQAPNTEQDDIARFMAAWLELQYPLGLKEEALKNRFNDLLDSRRAEICAAYGLAPATANFKIMSEPVIASIRHMEEESIASGNRANLKLDNMLTDLCHPPKDRRGPKKKK